MIRRASAVKTPCHMVGIQKLAESMERVFKNVITKNFLRNWVACSGQKVCFYGCQMKCSESAITVSTVTQGNWVLFSGLFTVILNDPIDHSFTGLNCSPLKCLIITSAI